jgi:hypothetical protein
MPTTGYPTTPDERRQSASWKCRWRTPISAALPGLLTCVSRALIPHPEPIRTRESSPVSQLVN